MIDGSKIAVVVPAFNEERLIGTTVSTIPGFVDRVFVIDDASTDGTAEVVESLADPRISLICHEINTGVGGAIISGHKAALDMGMDISAVMAGDAQMPPEYLESLIRPLVDNEADFTKGNRFFSSESTEGMPALRAVGSVVLSYLMKLSSGNWRIFDPQNGYTAIHRRVLSQIDLDRLSSGYSFENSMLINLNIARARVRDVDIPASYGSETSSMRLLTAAPTIFGELISGFFKRMYRKHVSPVPSIAGILFAFGALAVTLGIAVGVFAIWGSLGASQASAGTAILAVGGVIVGLQFSIAAVIMDHLDGPRGGE